MVKHYKKIIAPIALMFLVVGLMVNGAFALDNWDTTTKGLDVRTDVSAIGSSTGRTLNMSILGLDDLGNVDIYGATGGSDIIAAVTSLLGTVHANSSPSTAAGSSSTSSLAASTAYVKLIQGIGLTHITYANDANGTDVVKITLYEARKDESGSNYQTRQIASQSVEIAVAKSSPIAAILNVESFTKASSDSLGDSSSTPASPANEDADSGLYPGSAMIGTSVIATGAKMSVNAAGGLFVVKAYKINSDRTYTFDSTASGTVTVMLAGNNLAIETRGGNRATSTNVYTMTGTMQDGSANISVPTGITKAGVYAVIATMDQLSSINHRVTNSTYNADMISVIPGTSPAMVGLASNMAVVSNTSAPNLAADADDDGIVFDPTFTAVLLDSYGNYMDMASNTSQVTVKVTDTNSKISDFNILINASSNYTNLMVDGSSFTTGLASLKANVPLNSLIKESNVVSLKIVSNTNQIAMNYTTANDGDSDLYASAVTVGTSFNFSGRVGVDANADGDAADGTEANAFLATDTLTITNMVDQATGSREFINVAVMDNNPDYVKALFTYPTTAANLQSKGFLVQHKDKSYADCIVYPKTSSALAFTAASPSQAVIRDYLKNTITEVTAKVNTDGTFTFTLDSDRVALRDSYSNTNNSGNITITTSKGTASGAVAVGTAGQTITINYPKGTTGEDVLTISFTQPGISGVNDGKGLKVLFPTVETLAKFDTYPDPGDDELILPINGAAPLAILPRNANGNLMTVADGYFIDFNSNGIGVKNTAGTSLVDGANVGAATNRYIAKIEAKTTPGTYDLKVRSVDSTITKTIKVKVVEYTVPLTLGASSAEISLGTTKSVTISGGVSPYTAEVETAGQSAVVATVEVSTLNITGEALGGPYTVTVTDANETKATVTVTVVAPKQFTVAPTSVTVEIGYTAKLSVSAGTAPYTIATSDATTASVDKTDLTADGYVVVTGVKIGTATLTIKDAALAEVTVPVTVKETTLVTFPTTAAPSYPTTIEEIEAVSPVTVGSLVPPIEAQTHPAVGSSMQLNLSFPKYSEKVDVYVGVGLPPNPVDSKNIWLVNGTSKVLQPLDNGFITAYTGTGPYNENIFESFPVCGPFGATVPEGTWLVAWIVLPAGTDINAVDWVNDQCVFGWYFFHVTCP
ncbi:MAG: hypothetical protein HQK77_01755 [Desulfobacterales bacterium]|nr:hypothetical protein [Desulfobacterales bacterium]